MGRGEKSTALAFDHLGDFCHERSLRFALAGIAAEERKHRMPLAGLWACLPRAAARSGTRSHHAQVLYAARRSRPADAILCGLLSREANFNP